MSLTAVDHAVVISVQSRFNEFVERCSSKVVLFEGGGKCLSGRLLIFLANRLVVTKAVIQNVTYVERHANQRFVGVCEYWSRSWMRWCSLSLPYRLADPCQSSLGLR